MSKRHLTEVERIRRKNVMERKLREMERTSATQEREKKRRDASLGKKQWGIWDIDEHR